MRFHKTILFLAFLFSFTASAWAVNLSQLRQNAKDLMAKSGDSYTSDAVIDSSINRSIIYVSNACSCMVNLDSITTTVAKKHDTLPDDFGAINAVFNIDKKIGLDQIQVKDLGFIKGTATADSSPTFFYIYGKTVGDSAGTTSNHFIGWEITPLKAQKIYIWYYPTGKKLTSGGAILKLPDEFNTAVIYRAIKEIYGIELEYDDATWWGNEADKEIALAKAGKLKPLDRFTVPKAIGQ